MKQSGNELAFLGDKNMRQSGNELAYLGDENMVLGTFPLGISQGRLPKGYVRPSQAPQAAMGTERWDQDGLGGRAPRLEQTWGRALRLGQTWEVAAWEIAHLGSCHLGKILWGNNI